MRRAIQQAGTGNDGDRGEIENFALVAHQSNSDHDHGAEHDRAGNPHLAGRRPRAGFIGSLVRHFSEALLEGQPIKDRGPLARQIKIAHFRANTA